MSLFEMASEGDRAPIVNEMETEHDEVPAEVAPAAATATSVWRSWLSPSDNIRDTISASKNTLVYTLVGGSAIVTLWFATKTPSEMTGFHWHVVLSIIGYQFLMPHAFLTLQNLSWVAALSFEQRRRAHWILQLIGSILALIGTIIMSARKTTNYNTVHGKLALAALIFTFLSFVNGVSSLYATQLRRYISPRISKISHTLVGVIAFVLSSACLITGYLKHSFIEWAAEPFAYTMIVITSFTAFFVVMSPTYSVSRQLFYLVKNKIFL